jgi:hypothetical protein
MFKGFIEVREGTWYSKNDGSPWSNIINIGNGRFGFCDKLKKLKSKTGGYYIINVNGENRYWHRMVYEKFINVIPNGMEVDHINNIRDDNRIENLQLLTHQKNSSKKSIRSDNKTNYPCVQFCNKVKKWYAQITIDCISIWLGYHLTAEQAFICYLENKIYYHGWDSILPLI